MVMASQQISASLYLSLLSFLRLCSYPFASPLLRRAAVSHPTCSPCDLRPSTVFIFLPDLPPPPPPRNHDLHQRPWGKRSRPATTTTTKVVIASPTVLVRFLPLPFVHSLTGGRAPFHPACSRSRCIQLSEYSPQQRVLHSRSREEKVFFIRKKKLLQRRPHGAVWIDRLDPSFLLFNQQSARVINM